MRSGAFFGEVVYAADAEISCLFVSLYKTTEHSEWRQCIVLNGLQIASCAGPGGPSVEFLEAARREGMRFILNSRESTGDRLPGARIALDPAAWGASFQCKRVP